MSRFFVTAGLALSAVGCGSERTIAPPVDTPPVASISIEPTSVILEAGLQRNVTATLRNLKGAIVSGQTVEWTSSSASVATVVAGANSAGANIFAIAPGTTTIFASVGSASATVSVSVVAAAPVDFAITDAQWTQGSQNINGNIPMVLDGNAAVLNVVMTTTSATRLPGQLRLTLTDASGAVVRTDSVAPLQVASNANMEAPTAQFLVPASALRAGLRWQVRRDPRRVASDVDSTNDVFPASPAPLATTTLPVMRLRFVPVALSSHGSVMGNVSNANVEGYLNVMRRIFPLGRLEVSVAPPIVSASVFGTPPIGGNDAFWIQVLQDVDLARVADTTSRDTYWIGVIVPPSGFNFTTYGGMAYIPTTTSATGAGTRSSTVVQTGWFTNTIQAADLVVHEIAHNLGRRHAPCGGPSSLDATYPFAGGIIGTAGHDVYGWSSGATSAATTRASNTADVMSYCHPAWMSPYTYNGLMLARQSSAPVALRVGSSEPVKRERVLVVRGSVTDGRMALLPTVAIDGVPTTGSQGAYLVELLSADGRVLSSQRTDANAVDHADTRTFIAALPVSARLARFAVVVRVSGPSGAVIQQSVARPLVR